MTLRAYLLVTASVFLALAFTPSSATPVSTEECTTVDLRKEFPLKIRDQGDISWCYAHAAADYLQFYYKVPEQISAADLAVQFNQGWWTKFRQFFGRQRVPQTGFVRSVLWQGMENGYCPEEYFPSELWVKRFKIGTQAGQSERYPLLKSINDIFDLKKQIDMGLYLNASEMPYSYEFKDLTEEQFFEIIVSSPEQKLLNNLRLAACQNHRKTFPAAVKNIAMPLRGPNAFKNIDSALNQKIPVTVDYFYGYLNNANQYSRALGELHSTILMGRRLNEATGQCQYLIKNSYGPNCGEYDKSHQCENGHIWVDSQSLFKAMTSYVYVTDGI